MEVLLYTTCIRDKLPVELWRSVQVQVSYHREKEDLMYIKPMVAQPEVIQFFRVSMGTSQRLHTYLSAVNGKLRPSVSLRVTIQMKSPTGPIVGVSGTGLSITIQAGIDNLWHQPRRGLQEIIAYIQPLQFVISISETI